MVDSPSERHGRDANEPPFIRLWHRFQDWVDRIADKVKASDRWYW